MGNIKKLKYIAVVTLCSILDFSLHGITSKISPGPELNNLSLLAKTIGTLPVVMLWILIAYSIVVYVFYRYEDKLPGVKSEKGLRYGIAIGLLWLWGVVEASSISGTTLIHETLGGISDGGPVVLMGLLLATFTIKKNSIEDKKTTFNLTNIFSSVLIFSSVFLVGRYCIYFTRFIKSGYETRPCATFIWTLFMGMFVCVIYNLLGQTTKSSSTLLSAIKFGVIIFGVNWAVFQLFMPLVFEGTLVDIIIRSFADILFATLSYYLSESLVRKMYQKSKI